METSKNRLATLVSLCLAVNISAATLYWNGTDISDAADGGSGAWNASALNWNDAATGGGAVSWTPSSDAVFGGTAGTVTLGDSIQAETVSFNLSGYEIATAGHDLTLSALSGSGDFTKSGAGTLIVTGGGSYYSGNITVAGGTLKLGAGWSVLGDGNFAVDKLTVASGATFDVAGQYDTRYGLTLVGNGINGQGAYINSGADTGSGKIQFPDISLSDDATIGGTGNFYMIAPGYGANTLSLNGHTLTKVGANTFCMINTSVTAGKVYIAEGGFGVIERSSQAGNVEFVLADAAGSSLVLNNQWMHIGSLAGGGAIGGNVLLGSGTLNAGTLNTSTVYGGVISGAGHLVKKGRGALTLTGANTYTGNTTLESGQLNIVGSLTSNITVAGGRLAGRGSTTGALIMNAGNIVLAGGAITEGLSVNGVVINQPTVVLFDETPVNGTVYDVLTYGGGTVSNLVDLTVPYRGTLTNDIANAKLVFTASADGQVARTWNTTSGTWDLSSTANWLEDDHLFYAGDNVLFGDISTNSEVTLSGSLYPGSVTVSNTANQYVFSGGKIAGATDLIKSGAGTLVLSNNNAYTGTTRVNRGVLKIGNMYALGVRQTGYPVSQVLVSSGGTVDFNGVIDAVHGYTIAGSGADGEGALVNTGSRINNYTAQCSNIRLVADASVGGISDWALLTFGYGATTLDLAGHTLTKSGTNSVYLCNSTVSTGTIHVVSGAIGQTGAAAVDGSRTKFVIDNSPDAALKVLGSGGLSVGELRGGGEEGGLISINWGSLRVGALNTPSSFAGTFSGGGSLIKTGTNTLLLSRKSWDFSGPVVVEGGILKLGSPWEVLGGINYDVTKVTVASGATLDVAGQYDTSYGLTLAGSGTDGQGAYINTGVDTGGGRIQFPNISLSDDATIGGTGNFHMIAPGYDPNTLSLNGFTLTKAGTNTFSLVNTTVSNGIIHIAEGIIALHSKVSDASAADITFADTVSAELRLQNNNFSAGSLAGGGASGGRVSLGGGTLTTGARNTNALYAGSISGSGALVKTGSGSQTLAGANTYSGTTTVSGGALLINGSHTGGGGYQVDAGAVLGGAGEVTIANGTVDIKAGARLSPGTADQVGGTLTLSALTMAAAATLAIDNPADKVVVEGPLSLDNTSVAVADFEMLNPDLSYPILTCRGDITGALNKNPGNSQWIVSRRGNTFWITANSGAVIIIR